MKCFSCGREKFYWNTQKKEGTCHRCKKVIKGEESLQKKYGSFQSSVLSFDAPASLESVPPDARCALGVDRSRKYLASRYVQEDYGILYSTGCIYAKIDPLSPEYPEAWVRRQLGASGGWFCLGGTPKAHYAFQWNKLGDGKIPLFVEGVFDAIPNRFNNAQEVAILGSYVSKTLKDAIDALNPPFVLSGFDPDEAGQKATESFSIACRSIGVPHLALPLKYELGDMSPHHPHIKELQEVINEYI